MAQKLFNDKIPTLTEAGGTITMPAGARLTIGGQQYITTSALNVAADVSTANTRYQVFAVLNSGVVELVVSSNENSVGPAGHIVWKLVGSYYTNGLSSIGFGSFVNITGTPRTGPIDFDMQLGAVTTAPTRGGVSSEKSWWARDGRMMEYHHNYFQNSVGVAGSGTYYYFLPNNLSADLSLKLSSNYQNTIGNASFFLGSAIGHGSIECNLVDRFIISADTTSSDARTYHSNGWYSYSNATLRIGINARCPLTNFDETPIEDL